LLCTVKLLEDGQYLCVRIYTNRREIPHIEQQPFKKKREKRERKRERKESVCEKKVVQEERV